MTQLTKIERQEIEYYRKKDYSARKIGLLLKRHHSVISRELKRNSVAGSYEAKKARHKAYQRRYWVNTDQRKVKAHPELLAFLEEKIKPPFKWSPDVIAGRWNRKFGKEKGITISHVSLYRYLYKERLDLCKYLCTKRTKRKKYKKKTKRQLIPNRVWIDDRPKIVDEKERIGDLEGDTIVSRRGDKTVFLVLTDRASRYVWARKCPNKKPSTITPHIQDILKEISTKSLTLDNGIEFREHEKYGCPTYFCHPFHSWEKGAVENRNRQIRSIAPKKSYLGSVTKIRLQTFIQQLNNTPRKSLKYATPLEILASSQLPP